MWTFTLWLFKDKRPNVDKEQKPINRVRISPATILKLRVFCLNPSRTTLFIFAEMVPFSAKAWTSQSFQLPALIFMLQVIYLTMDYAKKDGFLRSFGALAQRERSFRSARCLYDGHFLNGYPHNERW
jgi:hypothetical protein